MSEPYLGEIRIFSQNFPPKGWAVCNGQILSIAQNQALFAILGTTYGGNGTTTFALPDLRGRVPIGWGSSIGLGQAGGENTHALTQGEMPAHIHGAVGSNDPATTANPAGKLWASPSVAKYGAQPSGQLASQAIQAVGGGAPHENRQPYTTLFFCIATTGIFPSRD